MLNIIKVKKNQKWISFAFVAFFGFGLSYFFWKLAAGKINVFFAAFLFQLSSICLSLPLLLTKNYLKKRCIFKLDFTKIGFIFIVIAGLAAGTADLTTIIALVNAPVSIVSPFVSLYGIIPIILGTLFLKEKMAPKQALGVIFALLAIYLFV